MTSNLYTYSIPAFIGGLETLAHLLKKAESSGKVSGDDLNTYRLVDDMRGLTFQVQRVCDNAKFSLVRIAGVPDVQFADDETTYAQLQERISKVITFLKENSKPEQFVGKEKEIIDFKLGPVSLSIPGDDYVTKYALPNFYFHLVTAYDILRANGVEIGKRDYIGIPLKEYVPFPGATS